MKTKQQKYLKAFKVLLPIGIVFLALTVIALILAIASGVSLSQIGDKSIQYSSDVGAAEQAAGTVSANFVVALLGSAALITTVALTVINAIIGGVCLTLALVFRTKGKKPSGPTSGQN